MEKINGKDIEVIGCKFIKGKETFCNECDVKGKCEELKKIINGYLVNIILNKK